MVWFLGFVATLITLVVLSVNRLLRWARAGDRSEPATATALRRHRRLILVAGLYVSTWIGGTWVYRHDMHTRAAERYADALIFERTIPKENKRGKYISSVAFKNGPTTALHWSVPILPAVLIVSSDYIIGPLNGDGGPRLVVWYGFGTWETMGFGWIA